MEMGHLGKQTAIDFQDTISLEARRSRKIANALPNHVNGREVEI